MADESPAQSEATAPLADSGTPGTPEAPATDPPGAAASIDEAQVQPAAAAPGQDGGEAGLPPGGSFRVEGGVAAEEAAPETDAPEEPSAATIAAQNVSPVLVGSRIESILPGSAVPPEVPDLVTAASTPRPLSDIDLLDDVELAVKVELGRTEMYIEDVLRLGAGSVIELDKLAGDPVDVFVNERLIARGEVLVLNDNFCVRINDIVSPAPQGEDGE